MSPLAHLWTTPQLGWRDPQIAVGHNFVIVTTNTLIGYYTKDGKLLTAKPWVWPGHPAPTLQNPVSTSTFFASLKPSLAANLNLPAGVDPKVFGFDAFYDTRVIFDPWRGRFWIGAIAINSNTKNEKSAQNPSGLVLTPAQRGSRRTKILIAVSRTEDPRDGWHYYWWDGTKDDGQCNYGENCTGEVFIPGDSGDYPYIGIDSNFLIQTNIVGNRDPLTGKQTNRLYAMATVVDANALAAGDGLPVTLRPGNNVFGDVYAPLYTSDGRQYTGAVQPALHLTNDTGGSLFLVGLHTDADAPDNGIYRHNVTVWTRGAWVSQLVITQVPIAAWGDAVMAPQASDATVPNPLPLKFRNASIFSATYRNKLLYLAFGDSGPGSGGSIEAMRVVRIPVLEDTNAERTSPAKGYLDRRLPATTAGTAHYGWPALTATANGAMVLAYQRTSPTQFPDVRYNVWHAGKSGPDPSVEAKAGQMPQVDKTLTNPSANGDLDMINIAPDPNGKSAWFAHPYPYKPAPATGANYRLAVGEVVP
jgi:hypothetical protein